ncbi:MAG: thermonuclease family protein [Chloroflexi bacterium]|nr:thermonuclease family protein [Chloroflexota bacterium]
MYEYGCQIVRVYDGDTVTVDIDLGFGVWLRNRSVRVGGIDTPELRTRNAREKVFGYKARDRMRELLPVGSRQVMRTYTPKPDKYGRVLGNFVIEFDDGSGTTELASEVLIEERLAVAYHGQAKADIEAQHTANWDWWEAQA